MLSQSEFMAAVGQQTIPIGTCSRSVFNMCKMIELLPEPDGPYNIVSLFRKCISESNTFGIAVPPL